MNQPPTLPPPPTLKESSRAQLYLNGIVYLNFYKELLILVEANFSHLFFTLPPFLLRFVTKGFSKMFT